jgi:transcriptional regulator with XRE-family HTH domain
MGLLPGMAHSKGERSEVKALAARQTLLRKYRKKLQWSQEEMARRLRVTVSEYTFFEEGRIQELSDVSFDEIKDYLSFHIKTLGLDGSYNMEGFE